MPKVTVRFNKKYFEKLKDESIETGNTVSSIIRTAVVEYYKGEI